ncbi:hypothetical protein DESC_140049 [Desulfosarcina cetonica]|nr:hypothetical protein DESC_140049 [Desulfosarcina cetonica]
MPLIISKRYYNCIRLRAIYAIYIPPNKYKQPFIEFMTDHFFITSYPLPFNILSWILN